jgi:hypothetical protein
VFAHTGNVWLACRAVGVPRRTVYWWREHSPAFAEAWVEAEADAYDRLKHAAWVRAVEGIPRERVHRDSRGQVVRRETWTQYSDQLLMLLLQLANPEKYRGRPGQRAHHRPEGRPLPTLAITVVEPRAPAFDHDAYAEDFTRLLERRGDQT